MMSSLFATVLMWANALVIVALTMGAYKDAIQHKMHDARKHLQIAGLIAIASAAMSSIILYEQKLEAATRAIEIRDSWHSGPSWNSYPTTHTVSR